MSSLNWKWAVLAPVTVMSLTACPDRHKDDPVAPVSPYTGYWIDSAAFADYNQFGADAQLNQFCERVKLNPAAHGCTDSSADRPNLNAWRVYPSGQVFEWTPTLDNQNFEARKIYYVGQVRADGFFIKQVNPNPRSSLYSNWDQRQSWTETSKVVLHKKDFIFVYRDAPGGGSEMHSLTRLYSEVEMQDYTDKVRRCRQLNGMPEPRGRYQTYGGGQPGPATYQGQGAFRPQPTPPSTGVGPSGSPDGSGRPDIPLRPQGGFRPAPADGGSDGAPLPERRG